MPDVTASYGTPFDFIAFLDMRIRQFCANFAKKNVINLSGIQNLEGKPFYSYMIQVSFNLTYPFLELPVY